MGFRCAGQLAGDGWVLWDLSPRGGPLPLEATISSPLSHGEGTSWPSLGPELVRATPRKDPG